MTLDKERFYWNSNPEWWFIGEDGEYHLTEKAPERAKKASKRLKHLKENVRIHIFNTTTL